MRRSRFSHSLILLVLASVLSATAALAVPTGAVIGKVTLVLEKVTGTG